MALDHGVLNVPLAKRGDIDAQIDKYKAEQARDARAKSKADAAETKAQRVQAKALVAALSADKAESLARNNGLTVAQVRARLKSEAHWLPERVIRLLGGAA